MLPTGHVKEPDIEKEYGNTPKFFRIHLSFSPVTSYIGIKSAEKEIELQSNSFAACLTEYWICTKYGPAAAFLYMWIKFQIIDLN